MVHITDQILDRFWVEVLRMEMSIQDSEGYISFGPHGEMMQSPHAGGVDFEQMGISFREWFCFVFHHKVEGEGFYPEYSGNFF